MKIKFTRITLLAISLLCSPALVMAQAPVAPNAVVVDAAMTDTVFQLYEGTVTKIDKKTTLSFLGIGAIDEFSFAIAQLDDYEGIDNVEGNSIFKREKTMVTFENEQTQEAWIYWFAGDINGKELIESGDVLEFMQQQQNK